MSSAIESERQFLVLVLGSHRSGSSVTTKILQSLGCNLGNELLIGDPNSNAMGHFENLEIFHFHENLLRILNTDWRSAHPWEDKDYFANNRNNIEHSVGDLLDSLLELGITAIKEPRMSIFLDIWENEILKRNLDLRIIITIRHPAEVSESLQKRDNLSPILGLHLWAQSTLNAIKFARDKASMFVFYDELMTNTEVVTLNLEKFLDLPTTSDLGKVNALKDVVFGLRHHKVNNHEMTALNIASDMYQYISRFNSATSLDFPEELLFEWQNRIHATYQGINREELIRITDMRRDHLISEITHKYESHLMQLKLERDQIVLDYDRMTRERDQLLNSTIWKATKPLRSFVNFLKS